MLKKANDIFTVQTRANKIAVCTFLTFSRNDLRINENGPENIVHDC